MSPTTVTTRIRLVVAMCLGVSFGAAGPVAAHHSFFGEFDIHQPITVTGVVTKVEWTNPHIRFYLDVTDRKGQVTRWIFLGAAAAGLVRQGVSETSLKIGERVKVDGFRALEGNAYASAGRVTLPGGKRLFVGPLEDPTPI
ncbi:MAG: DUF6152 family protein [Vicinamibacterales bacterium]